MENFILDRLKKENLHAIAIKQFIPLVDGIGDDTVQASFPPTGALILKYTGYLRFNATSLADWMDIIKIVISVRLGEGQSLSFTPIIKTKIGENGTNNIYVVEHEINAIVKGELKFSIGADPKFTVYQHYLTYVEL